MIIVGSKDADLESLRAQLLNKVEKRRSIMKTALFLILLVILGSAPAKAEFYRYTDGHGNTLYTDDLSNVPPGQRQTVREYEEAPAAALTEEKAVETQAPSTDNPVNALENERKQLQQQEKDLNGEYEALQKKRDSLDQERGAAVTPEQIKAYNQKIVDFNTHIKSYEERRTVYTERVKSFNDRLRDGTGTAGSGGN